MRSHRRNAMPMLESMLFDTGVGALVEPIGGRRWEADEIRTRVRARAVEYRRTGFRPGDRVFIHFGNCNEFFAELLAVWSLGAARFRSHGLHRVRNRNAAAWAARNFRRGTERDPNVAALSHSASRSSTQACRAAESGGADPPRLPRSTTTRSSLHLGHDRAAQGCRAHASFAARALDERLRDHLGLDAYRRTLCLLPTHFGHGLICNCLFPGFRPGPLHPAAVPARPALAARHDRRRARDHVHVVGAAVWRLALRTARPPRAGTLAARVRAARRRCPPAVGRVREWTGTREVFNAYGITETGSWVAGTTVGDSRPRTVWSACRGAA